MNEESGSKKSGLRTVKAQPSTIVTWKWLSFLGLLILVVLWTCVPPVLGQEPIDNRRLEREQIHRTENTSQRRVALVIGNSAYQNASRLTNPVNDASDMAAALLNLGFKLVGGHAHIDQTAEQMKRLIVDFGDQLAKGGVGLFYYAGHGVQSQGRNYLVPVEANILREKTLEFEAVDMNRVLAEMDAAGNGFNIVILDACRNNPFARGWRDTGSGLAQVSAPEGTLIAYATSPGRVASDGSGRNGAYTGELLRQIRVQGLKIEEMFKAVRAEVKAATKDQQTPWESSSLVGAFYFNPPQNDAQAPETKRDSSAFELSYWETIKSSNDPQDFKAYMNEYPNGRFVTLARNRINSLETAAKSPDSRNVGDNGATELAFWNTIKDSNDLEDFNDYVSRYPAGQFAGVARRRIAVLVPNPLLVFAGQEDYEADSKNFRRYKLTVTNRAVYPEELFAASPNLSPCGNNTNSARTWVDIFDGSGKRLYGFCALTKSEDLNNIWFALPKGDTPPSKVYIVLTDRLASATHKSNQVIIPPISPRPPPQVPNPTSPQLTFVRKEDFEANGKKLTRYKLTVTNRAVYPDELFAASPNLSPCGRNANSARTWVDIFDGSGKRLYGFCALTKSEDLNNIWFALPTEDTPPSQVYIVLMDRLKSVSYRSNLTAIQ